MIENIRMTGEKAFEFDYEGHHFSYDGRDVVSARPGEFHPRYVMWARANFYGKEWTREIAEWAAEIAAMTIVKRHEDWAKKADEGEETRPWGERR